MGKRGRKEKIIDPKRVEVLASKGAQTEEIAKCFDISVSGYYTKTAKNPEILEAYRKGPEAFLDYVKTTRSEAVLTAFDDLIQQRNPAAVIFAMKAIVGLQENVQVTHSVAKETASNDERLAELEAKRQALKESELDAEFTKDDTAGT